MKTLLLTPLMALASCLTASAATIQFTATIDSTLNGTGSPGTGTATGTLDDVSGMMTIMGNFSGLNGNTSAAHLHGLTASPGSGSAGVLFGLTLSPSGSTSGTFSGSGTIAAADIQGVIDGRSYINIHTSTNGGGEIRGFVNAVPEPTTGVLAAFAASALLLRRRRN